MTDALRATPEGPPAALNTDQRTSRPTPLRDCLVEVIEHLREQSERESA
jgi:hypothetical protein